MPAGELPATPSKAGEVPERFSNAGEIISLASQMVGADQKRAIWRSTVERLWSGEPVYPLEKLRQLNQSWRARTNYRGLEGLITRENTLDYDLETQGEDIVDIQLQDLGQGQQVQDWERIMECEFRWLMLERWKGYNYHIPKRHYQKNLHGLGIHLWPDTTGNWIPRTPCVGEVLFPDNCPFNFDEEGDYFMLRDFMPSYVLYGKIKNEKEAAALGWEVETVWKALTLLDKSQNRNAYGTGNPERLAKEMSQGDIGYWTTRQSGVWLNSILCREYETGKVSQYTIAEGLGLNEYLYKKRNKYDQWPLELFPYDIGNSTIHSVKGLGDRTKEFFEMMNRVQNATVDQVMLSSYPNMKQTLQNMDPDKMKLAKIGGMNIFPAGLETTLLTYPDLNRGPLALMDKLEKTMQDNNRGAGVSAQIEQQDRMTSEEYTMRSQDVNHLTTGSVAMQHAHITSFYDRILRLVVKPSASSAEHAVMAREFRDRCVRKGVYPIAFKSIGEVKAVLAFGKGSASARIGGFNSLLQSSVYLSTSDDRKIAIERGYVAALFGQKGVDQYCRSVDDQNIPNDDQSFAVMENDALMNGGDALATPRQNSKTHLEIHFGKITPIIQQYQQGMAQGEFDPQGAQQTYTAVNAFGMHIKQHLDFLQQNPTEAQAFQQYFNQWQQLSRIADKLKSDIESAQQATPPQQQVSEKLQVGLAGVQANAQVAAAKAQASAELKQRQQAHREYMDQVALAAKQQRENASTVHGMRLDTAETAASIAQDTALTAADIQRKKATAKATT